MEINLKPHTVMFTVAPSGSGKSTFCKDVLVAQIKEKYPDMNVQYISSDDLRRELSGYDADFHDNRMMETSQSAFKLLELKLETAMRYDIRAEFIIVDTTGLSSFFREYLQKVTKENHYSLLPITFDYSDRKEYYNFNTSDHTTSKQLKRFKMEVIREISIKRYGNVIKINKRRDASAYDVKIDGYEKYKSHFLDDTKNYSIVSDIHGCLDEFKDLIAKHKGSSIDDNGLINGEEIFIVQDYVDKGTQILETIEFIYHNVKNGKIIPLIGNHENFIFQAISGNISKFESEYVNGFNRPMLENQFGTYFLLIDPANEKYKDMFLEIMSLSKVWYSHKNFFVNHAPCSSKYLGKMDNKSIKEQRNYIYPKWDEKTQGEFNKVAYDKGVVDGILSKTKTYDNTNYRNIVWGHISMKNVFAQSRINIIDTGCVSGGKLSSINFDNQGRAFYYSVDSKQELKEDNLVVAVFEEKVKTMNDLEPKEKKRISYMVKDKINFIMGTMSPADKEVTDETVELESLNSGLNEFKNSGLDKVILEKKYMGSNCTVYLDKDIKNSYATSRNGYKIKEGIEMDKIYEKLYDRMKDFMDENNFKMIITSGELMPWSVLGKGLIDNTYKAINNGFSSEADKLKANGFYGELEKALKAKGESDFDKDSGNKSSKQLNDIYGGNVSSLYKCLDIASKWVLSEDKEAEYTKVHKRQIELFGNDGEPYFLPFLLLKGIREDGTEKLFLDHKNEDLYKLLSDDEYLVIDFNDEDYYEKAKAFYDKVCIDEELEGIVIKPEIVDTPNVVPFLKVRNPNYLTLVYGYDYQKDSKYKVLVNRKRLNGKLRASRKQWKIAKDFLTVPYNEISLDNGKYVNASINMVIEEKVSERLDPRL